MSRHPRGVRNDANQRNRTTDNNHRDLQEGQPSPSESDPKQIETYAEQANHRRREQHHWTFEKWATGIGLLFTAIAMGGAIASAYYASGAWEAARNAVREANRQAKAAESQVIVAEDTEKRQLRAYVGTVVGSFNVACPSCQFGSPKSIADGMTFELKNYGPTPAHRIISCSDVVRVNVGESPRAKRDELLRICDGKGDNVIVNPTIWPGETRTQASGYSISIEDFREILENRSAGFIFGRVMYIDIFDMPHNTYICRRLVPPKSSDQPIGYLGCNALDGPQDN